MDENMLTQLEAMPDRFAAELDELSEGELRKRPDDGGWNLKELAGHLRDVERVVGLERITTILMEDSPRIAAFDQEKAAQDSIADTMPLGETLAEWKGLRKQTVAMLRGLTPEDQRRTGQHEELGEITPVSIAEELARHDEHHLAHALELKGMSRDPSS